MCKTKFSINIKLQYSTKVKVRIKTEKYIMKILYY